MAISGALYRITTDGVTKTKRLTVWQAFITATSTFFQRGAPEFIQGAYITPNLFPVLQVEPAFGRMFVNEEDQFGKNRVVLLSHGLWQKRFSGDRNVVGQPISVAGEQYTVVGVMPAGMPFFDNLPEIDLWTPMSFAPGDNTATRNNHFINLVGRLKPDVTLQQAQADVSAIGKRMDEGAIGARVTADARTTNRRIQDRLVYPAWCCVVCFVSRLCKRSQPAAGPGLGS